MNSGTYLTKPDLVVTKNDSPKYKKTGTAVVNSLKYIYKGRPIKVYSAVDAIGFYKKSDSSNNGTISIAGSS